jgi:hypothetical protein
MQAKRLLKKTYQANYSVLHRIWSTSYYPTPWPTIRAAERSSSDRKKAIQLAIEWLFRSQDANPDEGGSSAFFILSLQPSWASSYPETTGYIITTLLEAIELDWVCERYETEVLERTRRMADWLLGLQRNDGSFPGGIDPKASESSIFNTAQILDGLLTIGQRQENDTYLKAAERAANWLTDKQMDDGSWETNLYDADCRTYLSHAAWPLAKAGAVEGFVRSDEYLHAAALFGRWAISQQRQNGWIEKCGFKAKSNDSEPINSLHTIAYTIEGILEIGLQLEDQPLIDAAVKAASRLLKRFEVDGILWGEYNERWRKICNFVCLTGVAQTSRCWLRIYEYAGDIRYVNAALKANEALRVVQYTDPKQPGTCGGFSGSNPLSGGYMPYRLPNWATKYALDAWLLEEQVMSTIGR